jgi:hypothetical protein
MVAWPKEPKATAYAVQLHAVVVIFAQQTSPMYNEL